MLLQFGVISPAPGSIAYRGTGRDGTASGFVRASYTSPVEGNALLARFAERCKTVGLPHVKLHDPSSDGGRTLVCGRTADDEYALGVTVSGANPTQVVMGEDIED